MVGVGVRVDDVVEAQPRPGGEREVAVDLTQLRVDEHRTARLGAAHEIGEAASRAHLLEDHRRGDSRASVPALSTAFADDSEGEVVTVAGAVLTPPRPPAWSRRAGRRAAPAGVSMPPLPGRPAPGRAGRRR